VNGSAVVVADPTGAAAAYKTACALRTLPLCLSLSLSLSLTLAAGSALGALAVQTASAAGPKGEAAKIMPRRCSRAAKAVGSAAMAAAAA
jgi:hypothetical protein